MLTASLTSNAQRSALWDTSSLDVEIHWLGLPCSGATTGGNSMTTRGCFGNMHCEQHTAACVSRCRKNGSLWKQQGQWLAAWPADLVLDHGDTLMQILARCPRCSATWIMQHSSADKRIRCRRCSRLFKVPRLEEVSKAVKLVSRAKGTVYVDQSGRTYGWGRRRHNRLRSTSGPLAVRPVGQKGHWHASEQEV